MLALLRTNVGTLKRQSRGLNPLPLKCATRGTPVPPEAPVPRAAPGKGPLAPHRRDEEGREDQGKEERVENYPKGTPIRNSKRSTFDKKCNPNPSQKTRAKQMQKITEIWRLRT